MSDGIVLSIVIPAFNEDNRLPFYLSQVDSFCKSLNFSYQIIVVDDGSVIPVAQWLHSFQVVRLPFNQGKGAALKAGVAHSCGEYVLVVDADGAYDIGLAGDFLRASQRGADLVIPYRDMPCSSFSIKVVLRYFASWLYRSLVRVLLLTQIRDAQCGFKLFRGDVARSLFSQIRENRWGIDTELLWRAIHEGYTIVQLPVTVRNDLAESKVSILPSAIQMLLLVFRLRFSRYH